MTDPLARPLELLPAVDVAGGRAVRLVQGQAGSETGYGDPVEAALDWARQGASWIHLVDHTHPGRGAIGGSLPSFALAFLLSVALTLAGRATARRDRPSCA